MNNYYNDNENLKFYLQHPDMQKLVTLREQSFVEYGKFTDAPANADEGIANYDKAMELVGDIAANVIAPNAEDVDKEGPHIENGRIVYAKGTQENHEALQNAGLYGLTLPRKYNGLNCPYVPHMVAKPASARDTISSAIT